MLYRFTTYPYEHTTMFSNPNSADVLVDEFYQNNGGYSYAFEQSADGENWQAVDLLDVKPGDQIYAQGLTFEVREVLSQYHFSETVYPETKQSRELRRCLFELPRATPAYPPRNKPVCHLFHEVEFLDTNGGYHNWKSLYDGGFIKRKEMV